MTLMKNSPLSATTSASVSVARPSGRFGRHGVPRLQDFVARAAAAFSTGRTPVSCGMSLDLGSGATETVASTDDLPVRFDWLQHELQQGPRVAAGIGTGLVVSNDVAAEAQWREFGPLCASVLEVRSVLSVPLPSDGSPAVLTWLSRTPGAFHFGDSVEASRLAREAVVLGLADAAMPSGADDPDLHNRLARAMGLIMARYRLQPTDAFFMLDKASRDLGCTPIELAAEVVVTGRLPARRINETRLSTEGRSAATA